MAPASTKDESPPIVTSVPQVPATTERIPFVQDENNIKLPQAGTARANIAATSDAPYGTTKNSWAERNKDQTVLQQHILFFDTDNDGIIWPQDTYVGFRRLGFNILLSFISLLIIHTNFSYFTLPPGHWLPDPFFRVHTARIHKDKHGSDSGTYDTEGRFLPQHFENIFAKYAGTEEGKGKDGMTFYEMMAMMAAQRVLFDPFGWGGQMFEWLATYILLWPEDGRMKKEDIRGVYDGSIFYEIAARREKKI